MNLVFCFFFLSAIVRDFEMHRYLERQLFLPDTAPVSHPNQLANVVLKSCHVLQIYIYMSGNCDDMIEDCKEALRVIMFIGVFLLHKALLPREC